MNPQGTPRVNPRDLLAAALLLVGTVLVSVGAFMIGPKQGFIGTGSLLLLLGVLLAVGSG